MFFSWAIANLSSSYLSLEWFDWIIVVVVWVGTFGTVGWRWCTIFPGCPKVTFCDDLILSYCGYGSGSGSWSLSPICFFNDIDKLKDFLIVESMLIYLYLLYWIIDFSEVANLFSMAPILLKFLAFCSYKMRYWFVM